MQTLPTRESIAEGATVTRFEARALARLANTQFA
jgi:hypothetical protein